MSHHDRYIPALRFRRLTRLYDPAIRWTTREAEFKRRLVEQTGPLAGRQVLDLGCGTGTLVLLVKSMFADAGVIGIDADHEILERARRKAADTTAGVQFDQGFSTELPYQDQSFDVVLSSLFFHHLTGADKRHTADEVARVLRHEGELHVADWGRPSGPLMRLLFSSVRLLDGLEQTRDNVAGALPQIFAGAGLQQATRTDELRTAFGTLALYRACKR